MAELPWMKMYTGDHLRDTHHLTWEEQGVLLLLLITAWNEPGCRIPDDVFWIARRLRANEQDFTRVVKPVLDEFFTAEDGYLFHKAQRAEYLEALAEYEKKSERGRKAANARWNNGRAGESSDEFEAPF